MAVTIIRKKLPNSNEYNNLMARTEIIKVEEKDILILKMCLVDNNLKIIGESIPYDFKNTTEEEFHKDLRKHAAAKQQLITSHSTNPEWNPENQPKPLSNEDRTPVQGC